MSYIATKLHAAAQVLKSTSFLCILLSMRIYVAQTVLFYLHEPGCVHVPCTRVSFKIHAMIYSNIYACDIQNLEDLASIAT